MYVSSLRIPVAPVCLRSQAPVAAPAPAPVAPTAPSSTASAPAAELKAATVCKEGKDIDMSHAIGTFDDAYPCFQIPVAAAVSGVKGAWAILQNPKYVSDPTALKALFDDTLVIESAVDLGSLLKLPNWEVHVESIVACLKVGKQVAFRECLGVTTTSVRCITT